MIKRFYKNATVENLDDGFTVVLDGCAINTPAKQPLAISIEELAEAVAAEWRAQKDEIQHDSMPMMRFVCTALDRVATNRTAVIIETIKFSIGRQNRWNWCSAKPKIGNHFSIGLKLVTARGSARRLG